MFFTPSVIKKRKALKSTAERAGWEGCVIQMNEIPATAKIPIIINGEVRPIPDVVAQYQRVYNLQTKSVESRGWLMDTLHIVERLDETFTHLLTSCKLNIQTTITFLTKSVSNCNSFVIKDS